jgi:hypothetical protein
MAFPYPAPAALIRASSFRFKGELAYVHPVGNAAEALGFSPER